MVDSNLRASGAKNEEVRLILFHSLSALVNKVTERDIAATRVEAGEPSESWTFTIRL